VSEIDQGQSRIQKANWLKRRSFRPHRLSPFVLYKLLPVCFRSASATTAAIFLLPLSSANRLALLSYFDPHPNRT